MNIENLTPHTLSLVTSDGQTIDLPPSGQVARLAVTRTALPPITILDGVIITVSRPTLGEITGLPPAQEGVILIVSALVAEAANREDVFSPGELIRSPEGVVIGAKGLCSYKEGK